MQSGTEGVNALRGAGPPSPTDAEARRNRASGLTSCRGIARNSTSYGEVVDRVRFDTARRLLDQSDVHIADIASAVGFTDQRNFARMFRRISGLSPREYRNTSSASA